MRLPVFLFDLDGPIIDSTRYAVEVSNSVLRKYGTPEITLEQYREALDSNFRVIARRIGLTTEEQVQDMENAWKSGIVNNHDSIRLYSGIDAILEKLLKKGHPLALVTRNFKESVIKQMKRFGLDRYFQKVLAYEDVKEPKPHEEHFLSAMKMIGVDAKNIVYVEDIHQSIITAKRLGMITIAVTWGYDTLERLKSVEPDFIANDIKELEKIIDSINLSFDYKIRY